jgi:hypothetical protein
MAINLNFFRVIFSILVAAILLNLALFCFYKIVYDASFHNSVQYFSSSNVDTTGSIYNNNGTWTLKDGSTWGGK